MVTEPIKTADPIFTYLRGLDAHLETLAPAAALVALDGEIDQVRRCERALAEWAEFGRHAEPAPTRFSAIDLARLDGELRIRMEKIRA